MTFILDIPELNVIICEYISIECTDYLTFIGQLKKYDYLCIEYELESKIEICKVRYLKKVNNLDNLIKYTNLISLTFDYFFNQEIKQKVLPNSLRSLTFGFDFNKKIKKDTLPNSLQS